MEPITFLSRRQPRTVILVAMALMLAMLLVSSASHYVINIDGIKYIYCAQNLAAGQWSQALEHQSMPFFPALIVLVHYLIPDWVVAAYLVCGLAMLLTVIPFYGLVYDVFGKEKALLSTLFFALGPSFISTAAAIVRDPLYLLFVMTFLWAFLRAITRARITYHALALASAGFAVLSRVEGIFILVLYLLILACLGLRVATPRIRKATLIALSLVVVATGIAGYCYYPQLSRLNRFGEVMEIVRHPLQFYQKLEIHQVRRQLRTMEELLPNSHYSGNILETTRNHILEIYLISLIQKVMECTFPLMLLLALVGIYGESRYKLTRPQKYLLLWLLFFLLIPYLFLLYANFLSRRYVMVSAALLCCWVGPGCLYLLERLRSKWAVAPAWLAVILLLLLAIPVGKILHQRSASEHNIYEAGRWLQQNYPQQKNIITNEPRILFYAGIEFNLGKNQNKLVVADAKVGWDRAKELQAPLVIWEDNHDRQPLNLGTPIHKFPGKKKTVWIYRVSEERKAE